MSVTPFFVCFSAQKHDITVSEYTNLH